MKNERRVTTGGSEEQKNLTKKRGGSLCFFGKLKTKKGKPVPLSSKVILERSEYKSLAMAAKKYITAEKKESKLQKALDAANRLIEKLKAEIAGLKLELSEYKSVRGKLHTSDLERENAELRGKIRRYEDVIQRNNLWHFFRPRREKAAMRDDAR